MLVLGSWTFTKWLLYSISTHVLKRGGSSGLFLCRCLRPFVLILINNTLNPLDRQIFEVNHMEQLLCVIIFFKDDYYLGSSSKAISFTRVTFAPSSLHQESLISSCLTLQHLAESASIAQGALVVSVTNLLQVRNLLASPNLPHLCVPFKVFKVANVSKVIQVVQHQKNQGNS